MTMSRKRLPSALVSALFFAAAGMGMAAELCAQGHAPSGLQFRLQSGSSFRLPAPQADVWFAHDKLRHAGSSAAIQIMGYGLLRLAGTSRSTSLLGATIVTAAAGIGKEVQDARQGGRASARDLVWDGIGILAGSGLARLGDGR